MQITANHAVKARLHTCISVVLLRRVMQVLEISGICTESYVKWLSCRMRRLSGYHVEDDEIALGLERLSCRSRRSLHFMSYQALTSPRVPAHGRRSWCAASWPSPRRVALPLLLGRRTSPRPLTLASSAASCVSRRLVASKRRYGTFGEPLESWLFPTRRAC